jgi:hypothetical protein
MVIIDESEQFSCCSQIVVLFVAREMYTNPFVVKAENFTWNIR